MYKVRFIGFCKCARNLEVKLSFFLVSNLYVMTCSRQLSHLFD